MLAMLFGFENHMNRGHFCHVALMVLFACGITPVPMVLPFSSKLRVGVLHALMPRPMSVYFESNF